MNRVWYECKRIQDLPKRGGIHVNKKRINWLNCEEGVHLRLGRIVGAAGRLAGNRPVAGPRCKSRLDRRTSYAINSSERVLSRNDRDLPRKLRLLSLISVVRFTSIKSSGEGKH